MAKRHTVFLPRVIEIVSNIDNRYMSVCPVPDPKSRTERRWNLKIGRKNTGYPWPHFEVERSKVKVTRPINAVTDNQPNAPSIPCGKLIPKTGAISAENDTEREGLRTSNLVHGWSTMSRITNMHGPTWKLWVQSQLAEAGNILLRPHCFFSHFAGVSWKNCK